MGDADEVDIQVGVRGRLLVIVPRPGNVVTTIVFDGATRLEKGVGHRPVQAPPPTPIICHCQNSTAEGLPLRSACTPKITPKHTDLLAIIPPYSHNVLLATSQTFNVSTVQALPQDTTDTGQENEPPPRMITHKPFTTKMTRPRGGEECWMGRNCHWY